MVKYIHYTKIACFSCEKEKNIPEKRNKIVEAKIRENAENRGNKMLTKTEFKKLKHFKKCVRKREDFR